MPLKSGQHFLDNGMMSTLEFVWQAARKILSTVVRTQVEFQRLSDAEMEKYWATGEPIGKAGAYAIQGIGAQYIPQIRGSYSNVVGLPLYETVQLLESIKASV